MDHAFLEIKDVCVEYNSINQNVQALDHINIKINEGEFVCILGASGGGKSTLLRTIAGFISPTNEGKIYLNGIEINNISSERGVVFQEPTLYEWLNVEKNINFGLRMKRLPKRMVQEKTEEILKTIGLETFAKHKVYELSGGMKQRVGLGRVLINDPDILLMDEPFSALDAMTREQMQDFMRQLWWDTKKTVLFITHDIDEALLLANRIIVMSERPGRVIEDTEVGFSMDILKSGSDKIKYTEAFFNEREKLLNVIRGV